MKKTENGLSFNCLRLGKLLVNRRREVEIADA